MGLLSKVFGGKKDEMEDGLWLKGEREGDWIEVLERFTPDQSLELNTLSCFEHKSGTYFCVLRSTNPTKTNNAYFGCLIEPDSEDEIFVVVQRLEKNSGQAIEVDSWSKSRVFNTTTTPGIGDVIARIKNIANFNDYSSPPPYALLLILRSFNGK